jgi:D-sedoheptulose 7-phosphate isomerase
LTASIEAKQKLLNDSIAFDIFNKATDVVIASYKRSGRLYIAGNGGSAADAQHLAAEFVSKLARDRAPLAAEALTVDSSIITAIGNDYGFENILNALKQCREMGITSIVFGGRDGGQAEMLADYAIIVPGVATSTIQELHIVLAHTLCESVEAAVFGEFS